MLHPSSRLYFSSWNRKHVVIQGMYPTEKCINIDKIGKKNEILAHAKSPHLLIFLSEFKQYIETT